MKAKKLMLAALAGVVAVSAASCNGSKAKSDFIVPETLDTTTQRTIKFYHTMGDSLQTVLGTAVDAFQTKYPNVTIEHTQVGSYDDVRNQITSEIANDNQPNIAYCYPDHVALYNRAKAVVTLDSLLADKNFGYDSSDLVPGYFAEGKQFGDELTYTLPFSKSTEVLYYNKTQFEKNGWTVPKTWEEMATLCRTIKEKYPNCKPLGIDSEANLFITLCEQIGSGYTTANGQDEEHYLFNNDQNKAFVEQFKKWYDEGLFTTQTISGGYTSTLFTTTLNEKKPDEFNGCFMSIGSTGGASHQWSKNFECEVTTIPTYGNVELKAISQGPSLCIFQKEDPQDVLYSWIFITDYLLDPTFQATFSMESGYNPVSKAAAEIEDYVEWLTNTSSQNTSNSVKAKAANTSKAMVNNFYTSPAFVGSSTAREQVGDLFVAAITGTKGIDEAFKDAFNACLI